jgi:hypothetical protein
MIYQVLQDTKDRRFTAGSISTVNGTRESPREIGLNIMAAPRHMIRTVPRHMIRTWKANATFPT